MKFGYHFDYANSLYFFFYKRPQGASIMKSSLSGLDRESFLYFGCFSCQSSLESFSCWNCDSKNYLNERHTKLDHDDWCVNTLASRSPNQFRRKEIKAPIWMANCLTVFCRLDRDHPKWNHPDFGFYCFQECGERNDASRIVNGAATGVNEFPWMARLSYFNRFYCGKFNDPSRRRQRVRKIERNV